MIPPVNDEFKIIFWNSRGLRNKITELAQIINDEQIDIVGINETFLDDNYNLPHIPGCKMVRIDKTNHSGGLLLIIRSHIQFTQLDCPNTSLLECVAIKIQATTPFIIYLIYCQGTTSSINSNLEPELSQLCNNNFPFFIIGDFNAKHRSWNCIRNNRAGKILKDIIDRNPVFLCHPDSPTYSPVSNTITPSTIDLLITDGRIPISPLRTLEILTSDHYPVQFEIYTSMITHSETSTIFNYSQANWDLYSNLVAESILPLYESNRNSLHLDNNTIDQLIHELTSAILNAQEESIPKFIRKGDFVVTPLLRFLIKGRNHFRRRYTRHHCEEDKLMHNILKRRAEQEKNNILNNKFTKIILECNKENNKIYKIIKNRRHVNIPHLNPVIPGNRRLTSQKSKAEALADSFENNHNNPLSRTGIAHTRLVNRSVEEFIVSDTQGDNPSPTIDINEVATLVKNLKINKASGLDNICPRIIKRLPVVAFHLLALIYTSCLKNAYFPDCWKIAKTIPIPKPNKNRREVSSYRPIALLSVFSKMLERTIYHRLVLEMEDHQCIPPFQFGFRLAHSAVHAIKYLIDYIRAALKSKKTVAALYFDVAKAFDAVWHNGLIYKMLQIGFSNWLIRITVSFLRYRKFQVHIGGKASSRRNIPYGVPQGSVLSPALYNVFVYDIPTPLKSKISEFADDTVLFSAGRTIKGLVKGVISDAKRTIKFFRKWKISINTGKTQIMFHTLRKTKQLPPESVSLGGQVIPRSTSVKYLGIHLDNRLTLRRHIEEKAGAADNLVRVFYPYIKRNNFATQKLKLKIYKTYVRPALLYGAPLLSTIATSNKAILQRKQNKFLRMVTNSNRFRKIVEMHQSCKLETVGEFSSRLRGKFLDKGSLSENPIIREICT